MNNKWVAVYQGALIIVIIMSAILLSGCGGDANSGTGGARGYVYQSTTGSSVIVSANSTPPDGYIPVPAGTVVRIEGYSNLRTTTNARGFYYLTDIPGGLQVLVVEGPHGTLTLSIPIIPCRITDGGGHMEGGG